MIEGDDPDVFLGPGVFLVRKQPVSDEVGTSSSLIASKSPLVCASHKRWTKALFSSADDI